MVSTHCFIFMNLFTTSQITKIKLTPKQHALFVSCITFNQYLEYCVWSWGVDIWPRLPRHPIGLSSLQKNEAIVDIGHDVFTLSFNEDSCILILTNIKCLIRIPILKKVKQFLIVNLQEWAVDCVADVGLCLYRLKTHKEPLNWPWDDAELLVVREEGVLTLLRFETGAGT